jgi:hypothetical protein
MKRVSPSVMSLPPYIVFCPAKEKAFACKSITSALMANQPFPLAGAARCMLCA